jgi:hypothetical protein
MKKPLPICSDPRKPHPVSKPEMLFSYLTGDDSDEAVEKAGQWIYANYAAWGYDSYLRHGRGFLVGPIVADETDRLLCPEAFKAAAEARRRLSLEVSYLTASDKQFRIVVPDPDYRRDLIATLNTYEPQEEVAILLLRIGKPLTYRPLFCHSVPTPSELYEATKGQI